MASSSVPARRSAAASTAGLRRLRRLCVAVVIVCAAALPFETGAVKAPALVSLPVVGKFFTPARQAPAVVAVSNYPKTAVIGHTEHFSVRLAGMSNAPLTYVLTYPNGRTQTATVHADAQGYSSYTFHIVDYGIKHFREENASISVQDAAGHVQAAMLFAIQKR